MNAPLDLFPLNLSFEPPKPTGENDTVQIYWYLVRKEKDEYVIRNIKYDVLLRNKSWKTLLKKAKWTFPQEKKEMKTWEALPAEVVGDLSSAQALATQETQDHKDLLQQIEVFEITDQEDLDFAANLLADVKGKEKVLATEESRATRPLKDVVKIIQSWFKPPRSFLKDCEIALKKKIEDYRDWVHQEGQRALQAASKASMKGNDKVAEAALEKAKVAKIDKIAGLQFREKFDYEIVDIEQIPAAYLMTIVDDEKVKAKIKKNKGDTKIRGLRIFRVTQIASRSK